MRIAIGGIGIESSTFCPHRSTVADFRQTRGQDLLGTALPRCGGRGP
nr:M81 family metallopeptidase [Streptomyces sp. SID10853]